MTSKSPSMARTQAPQSCYPMGTWRSGVSPNQRRGAPLGGRKVGPQLKERVQLRPHRRPPEQWKTAAVHPRKAEAPLQKRVSPGPGQPIPARGSPRGHETWVSGES